MPSTSIYSKNDGMVSWQYCIDWETGPQTQNIESFLQPFRLRYDAYCMGYFGRSFIAIRRKTGSCLMKASWKRLRKLRFFMFKKLHQRLFQEILMVCAHVADSTKDGIRIKLITNH
ncbi:MAG: hypothetical protein R2728_07470 [Chitinophagales bacterium]